MSIKVRDAQGRLLYQGAVHEKVDIQTLLDTFSGTAAYFTDDQSAMYPFTAAYLEAWFEGISI